MKIAIISSNGFNKYASTLINVLAKNSIQVSDVVLIRESRVKSIRRNLGQFGFKNTLSKVFQHLGFGSSIEGRDYLKEYAKGINVDFKYSKLKQLCQEKNIDFLSYDDINSKETVKELKSKNIDVLINCGRGLFRPGIIDAMNLGIFNAHMGILPEFRGMNVLEWSLFYNKPIGVTLHFIAKGIDTGDILLTEEIPIEEGENIQDLRDKSIAINVKLITEALLLIRSQKLPRIIQKPEDGKQFFAMHERLKCFLRNSI